MGDSVCLSGWLGTDVKGEWRGKRVTGRSLYLDSGGG